MRKGSIFWIVFVFCLFLAGGIAGAFVRANGIHKPVPREITVKQEQKRAENTVIPADTDYSAMSEPVTDGSGKLYIPDNTTVSEIPSARIKTRLCEFRIPEAWVGNVVIRVIRMDQETDTGLYENPVADTQVVQFFEAETFRKYRTQQFAYKENARRMGKLAEIRVMNAKANDTSGTKHDPQELYFANIKGKQPYEAFLYCFRTDADVIDEEYADRYAALKGIDYEGCIISSMRSDAGNLSPADTYIRSRYVDGFDENGPGISEALPDDYVPGPPYSQEIPERSSEVPAAVSQQADSVMPVYTWQPFAAPYTYTDHGSGYVFSPMESGGQPVAQPSVQGGADVDIDIDMPGGGTAQQVAPEEYGIVYEEPAPADDNWPEETYGDDGGMIVEEYFDQGVGGDAASLPQDMEILDLGG